MIQDIKFFNKTRLKSLLYSLSYQAGTSECECFPTTPIGSCLKCDMETGVETLKETIAILNGWTYELIEGNRVCEYLWVSPDREKSWPELPKESYL